MAVLKVCAVWDEKAESYMQPIFVAALGIASRDFVDACRSEEKLAKHKEDFSLYEVAAFDTNTANFVAIQPPRLMLRGTDTGGE